MTKLCNLSPDVRELNADTLAALGMAGDIPASPLEQQFAALLSAHEVIYKLEYRFHPTRRWRFDFAMPNHKVAVEVEGGTHSNGRHVRGAGYTADCEKYNAAVMLGWRVLRVTSDMLNDGRAVDVAAWIAEVSRDANDR